jgi:hypothetical protein
MRSPVGLDCNRRERYQRRKLRVVHLHCQNDKTYNKLAIAIVLAARGEWNDNHHLRNRQVAAGETLL